ncbi:type II secretion system protein GspM [Brevundimonas sp.]|uniref:type II secretion system protein GspM n=1 Tax=Brevundimonas sp. TaxID=1871086 RepID=UPI002D6EA8C3|nr:type II secretion system protein GspM [Brevundimonas sp.]HYD28159.1 type II secretion system protein GspM [Brevundimonas sp.]
MNRLFAELHQAWDGRTRREQRMLAAMALLVAAVVLWLGVVRPVSGWRNEAARDRARAEGELVEVRSALARLAQEAGPGVRRADARGLEPVVRQTAEAAGLELVTGMDASGRLGFRVANAPAAAVFGWLAALETTHGLQPASLSVVENADASLQVEGAF